MSFSFSKCNEEATSYRIYVHMDNELYDYFDFISKKEVTNFIDTFICKHPEEEKKFYVVRRTHYKDLIVKGEKL